MRGVCQTLEKWMAAKFGSTAEYAVIDFGQSKCFHCLFYVHTFVCIKYWCKLYYKILHKNLLRVDFLYNVHYSMSYITGSPQQCTPVHKKKKYWKHFDFKRKNCFFFFLSKVNDGVFCSRPQNFARLCKVFFSLASVFYLITVSFPGSHILVVLLIVTT